MTTHLEKKCCDFCRQEFKSGLVHCLGITTCPCHQTEKVKEATYETATPEEKREIMKEVIRGANQEQQDMIKDATEKTLETFSKTFKDLADYDKGGWIGELRERFVEDDTPKLKGYCEDLESFISNLLAEERRRWEREKRIAFAVSQGLTLEEVEKSWYVNNPIAPQEWEGVMRNLLKSFGGTRSIAWEEEGGLKGERRRIIYQLRQEERARVLEEVQEKLKKGGVSSDCIYQDEIEALLSDLSLTEKEK